MSALETVNAFETIVIISSSFLDSISPRYDFGSDLTILCNSLNGFISGWAQLMYESWLRNLFPLAGR